MLTRRQYEYLLIILAFAVVVIAWALSGANITMPTMPRIFQREQAPITLPVRTVDMPDVIARQITARDLQAAASATAGETAVSPDIIERQLSALEMGRIQAIGPVIPVDPAELSIDYEVGVPILTEIAIEDLTLKASLSRDYVVDVPLMTETAMANQVRFAALSRDYVVDVPILSVRSQAEAARLAPALKLPAEATAAQQQIFEASLNWADLAPAAVPVSDYAVELPLLTEMARSEQARLAALSSDYVVGVPLLTARAMAERSRNEALGRDYQIDLPLTTQPQSQIIPLNQRISEASRNWADFESVPAPRSAAASRIYGASLNWADFTPISRSFEPLRVNDWQGPQIWKSSLNWADYLN